MVLDPATAMARELVERGALIERLQADIASEAIRNEDLADALEEAADWAEKRDGSDRLVARWKRLLGENGLESDGGG